MSVEERLAALRRRLEGSAADAFLVTKASNMRYLSGFTGVFDEGINAACLVTAEEAVFHTDSRYAAAAEEAAAGGSWAVSSHRATLYADICRDLAALGVRILALEASVPYGRFRYISEQMVGRVEAVDQWVEELRVVKDQEELHAIATAVGIADAAYTDVLERLSAGRSEREVAFEMETALHRHGSAGVAFAPIVASGPNSARPHAVPTDRLLADGDLVILDFGARVADYRSDMTRTVTIGSASDRAKELHAAVLEANEVGRARVRAGAQAEDLDGRARDLLREKGLAELFAHGLGHGVGLDVHELPRLGPDSRDTVWAGTVVTVEPGLYEEGFGGVRIEDLVVARDGGSDLLTHASRDLVEI